DEVADMYVFVEHAFRAQACERADGVPRTDHRTVDYAVRVQFGVRLDTTVAQVAVGPDTHAIPQHDFAHQNDVHVDEHVATGGHSSAHIDTRRIRERDARQHQLVRLLGAQGSFELGKLHLVVHAEHFGLRGRGDGVHSQA